MKTSIALISTLAIITIRGDPIQKFDKDAILKSLSTRDRVSSTELLTDKNGNKLPNPASSSAPVDVNKPPNKRNDRLSGLDIDAILNSIKEQKSGNDDEEREVVVVVSSAPEEPQNDTAKNERSVPDRSSSESAGNSTEPRRNAFIRQKIESSINRKRDRASRRRHVFETILVTLSEQRSNATATTTQTQQ